MNVVYRICFGADHTTEERIGALMEGIAAANRMPKVRCITVTALGDCFLTGAVCEAQQRAYEAAMDRNALPVLVAVNGACAGIGLDLLRRADLACAAPHASIEGYVDAQAALEAFEINEVAEPEAFLAQYAQRLITMPEPLIRFGHRTYFAMEKLPDKLQRSQYGASVIDEVMSIQAQLNRAVRAANGGRDPYSDVEPDEEIAYAHPFDEQHAILFEFRDDVEYIQLNAPRFRNMFDWRSSMELAGAYAIANMMPELKAIVVTGTGKRFHLGGIRHNQDDPYEQARFAEQLRIRNQIMRQIRVPLIAAVNGECSGGGMSLVLKAQVVIAAESATFGYPEIRHQGFACNSMVNTMGVIPKKPALKCFYFGDLFSAREAQRFGFVHQVVPDDQLEEAVERTLAGLRQTR